MKLLFNYLLCILIALLSISSCQNETSQERLLNKAQNHLVTGKPDVALILLDSIQNPEKMDKDSYMQYIVIYTGAKYESKQDIKSDTLIFDAQRYFNEKGKSKYTPLANYYAAQLHDENGNFPKAVEFYMYTANSTDKSNNSLLGSKSLNNIGYIYYQQELYDSAIVNYQKALSYYDKVDSIDQRKLRILTNIGRVYEGDNKLDSAYAYFNYALEDAIKANNEKYKSFSSQNLGVVCYGMKNYDNAIAYFQSVIAMGVTGESEISQIHLYLLNIYNKGGDLKSAKQYADLVTSSLPEVTYSYTVKEMYAALSDYYKQSGDYQQALQYKDLEKSTNDKIQKEANAPALLAADKNYYLTQKNGEALELRDKIFLLLLIGISCSVIILFFLVLAWKNYKKDKVEIKLYTDKYNDIRRILVTMDNEYPRIEAEIKAILESD